MNNNKNLKNVLKSVFTLFVSDAVAVIFLTIFSIALGRWFGAKIFGEYSLAITLSFILRTLSDAGFELKIPRLIAKNPSTISSAIVEAQNIKIRIWLIFFAPTIFVGLTLMNDLDFIVMIIWVIPCVYASTFRAALRGMLQMKYIAIVESINNFLLTLFLFLVLLLYPKLYMIFFCQLIFETIKLIHYMNILNKKFNILIRPVTLFNLSFTNNFKALINQNSSSFDLQNQPQRITEIIKEQFKLTAITILDVLQMRVPTILLGWLTSLHTVGIFTASQRFITVSRIIPSAVFSTLLPNFSSGVENNKRSLLTPLIIAFSVGVIIAISINLLSGILITYTFAFEKAVIVLKILSWSFIFLMMNNVLQAYILSNNLENNNIIFLSIAIISVIITSIYIFPKYGAEGAAYSVVASEFLIFIFYLVQSLKLVVNNKESDLIST